MLSAEQVRKSIAIRDYMLSDGRLNGDPNATLAELSRRFVDAGLPLQRCVTIVRILHAINTASLRQWEEGEGTTDFAIPFTSEADGMYDQSPSALAHAHNKWVAFNPQDVPDDAFGIIKELKQAGFTHYVCAPTMMVNRMQNVFTFATKQPGGFTENHLAVLRATFPAIEACQEILVTHRILKEVTRTYVGEEPHARILAGDVHRGEVTSCQAAIQFTDMRDFTGLTASLSAQDATALLNDYYDCVVPAIEANGGEVLKFIGDGILAMFRVEDESADAGRRALKAAKQGLDAVTEHNLKAKIKFEIGTALHHGEVAYGNVGSGVRLDYTVIGRDVNLAARMADLCGQVDEKLLVSQQICDRLPEIEFIDCGTYPVKGLPHPVTLYKPKAGTGGF